MSVWSKLFGDKARVAAAESSSQSALGFVPPSPGNPSTVAVIPGKLTVAFHAHDALEGSVHSFLSAVTHGLHKQKQRELVISLRLSQSDDVAEKARDLIRFFTTVRHWARHGQRVDAGELTQFGERGLFGQSHNGLLYVAARPISGVDLPARALAGVLVDRAEARLAADCGVYRVLTRLAESQRHFPNPTWSEIDRPSVATSRESESMLVKVRRARTRSASFVVEGERLRILLSREVRADLRGSVASLPPRTPFALLVAPAADANALLVWHPGQKEPKAITPDGSDGSRLSGSCLLIAPGGQKDQTRLWEDGHSLSFSDETWARVSAALFAAKPLKLRMADDTLLELEWQSEDTADSRQL
ncbi:MAG TPA: hypothetical protein VHW01_24090 [Polyangiaceae bacterium]|nr:hypothetical protein [Polyangiaceae bacterium]